MKKKLLFVNESLSLAGGEKSLIALLSNLDTELYEIDLQLFRYGGELDAFIPSYVNILPPIPYTTFNTQSLLNILPSIYKKNNLRFLVSRLTYSLKLKRGKHNNPSKAQLYWEASNNSFPSFPKLYDVAIAYAQGLPTFYVIDKLKAKKKIAWINAKPNFSKDNKLFQNKYYEKYDVIVPVSQITHQQVLEMFPEFKDKIHTIEDIVDYQSILRMANLKTVNFEDGVFNILTVARLSLGSKRYDIALEACKILKERGLKFHWYALGKGSYRSEMERYIKENNLNDCFTLLGVTANPYPYFKAADLYVQTSDLESFGISIAEARLLNIPVVTTRFDTVFMQMVDGKNGLVVNIDASAVADGIERIMKDKDLYESIVDYLKNEEKDNKDTVKKFDNLITKLLD